MLSIQDTCRRYYRNSTLAFPNTVEYACCIESPRRPKSALQKALYFSIALAYFGVIVWAVL